MSGFLGIIFIRFFIEQFSVRTSSGIITSDSSTLVHYGIFYFLAFILFALVIQVITKTHLRVTTLGLFCLPIIWISPIIDFFVSHGRGLPMAYLLTGPSEIVTNFLTFFGPHIYRGATIGIRIEIALILCGVGAFVWMETQKVWKVLVSMILCYTAVFIMGAMPSFIYSAYIILTGDLLWLYPQNYIAQIIQYSTIPYNILHGAVMVPPDRLLELGFNTLMTQIFYIGSVCAMALYSYIVWKDKYIAVIKNSRFSRVMYYLSLVLLGVFVAYTQELGGFSSWVDVLGLLCLLIGWYGCWMFAVHVNDYFDTTIDAISNTDRPLVTGILSKSEMMGVSNIWLTVALVGTFSAGYYPFFMALVFLASSYIYSVDFLRFKRVLIVSSVLIGIASLASVLAGFFFFSYTKTFSLFPAITALGIIIMTAGASNIKDLKDYEGDKANNIYTIPVVFGEKWGRYIIATLFGGSFLLVPMFIGYSFVYIVSVPISICGFALVMKWPDKEKYFFALYAIFVILTALLFIPTT
jgi:4-hydroxybenzoate polyprenyltransferase